MCFRIVILKNDLRTFIFSVQTYTEVHRAIWFTQVDSTRWCDFRQPHSSIKHLIYAPWHKAADWNSSIHLCDTVLIRDRGTTQVMWASYLFDFCKLLCRSINVWRLNCCHSGKLVKCVPNELSGVNVICCVGENCVITHQSNQFT